MKSKERKKWVIPVTIIVSILLVIIGISGLVNSGNFSLEEDTLQFLEIFIGVIGLIVSFLIAKSMQSKPNSATKESIQPNDVLKENKQSVTGSKNITVQDISGSQINLQVGNKTSTDANEKLG